MFSIPPLTSWTGKSWKQSSKGRKRYTALFTVYRMEKR
jgi:hypothetical protein